MERTNSDGSEILHSLEEGGPRINKNFHIKQGSCHWDIF